MKLTFQEEVDATVELLQKYPSIFFYGYKLSNTFIMNSTIKLSEIQKELIFYFFTKNLDKLDNFNTSFSRTILKNKILKSYFEIE